MVKLSVCIDSVFMGQDVRAAVRQVKKAGISAVEFWTCEGKDISALKEAAVENGMEISAFCTDFISLVDETKRGEYLKALKASLETADYLDCKRIIVQAGQDMSFPRNVQRDSLIQGLKACAALAEEKDIILMLEPLNVRVDHKEHFLWSSDETVEILKEVDSSHVKMLFDIYHQQITEGDLIRRIREYMPYISHFHTAGNPGRHELYRSEIDYRAVISAIDETGYDGYIGLEYFPLDDVEKGLAYAKNIIQ